MKAVITLMDDGMEFSFMSSFPTYTGEYMCVDLNSRCPEVKRDCPCMHENTWKIYTG